jgi:hypothetical protein
MERMLWLYDLRFSGWWNFILKWHGVICQVFTFILRLIKFGKILSIVIEQTQSNKSMKPYVSLFLSLRKPMIQSFSWADDSLSGGREIIYVLTRTHYWTQASVYSIQYRHIHSVSLMSILIFPLNQQRGLTSFLLSVNFPIKIFYLHVAACCLQIWFRLNCLQ